MEIKAIETEYNGYRFRSRLEARWAVFFDAAGIKYEYEPEGFEFEDGTRYLPDFYLPWFHAYVEIKPLDIGLNEEKLALQKCEILFSKDNCVILFCKGDPVDCKMKIFCNDTCESGGGCGWHDAQFLEGAWYKHNVGDGENDGGYSGGKHFITISVGSKYEHDRTREYLDSSWEFCCLDQIQRLIEYRSDFDFEKVKARQARFEHGEKP